MTTWSTKVNFSHQNCLPESQSSFERFEQQRDQKIEISGNVLLIRCRRTLSQQFRLQNLPWITNMILKEMWIQDQWIVLGGQLLPKKGGWDQRWVKLNQTWLNAGGGTAGMTDEAKQKPTGRCAAFIQTSQYHQDELRDIYPKQRRVSVLLQFNSS